MSLSDDPIVCLACQQPIELDQLPLCLGCLLDRYGTIHPRWNDATWWRNVQNVRKPTEPIPNASEARFAVKQQRRNRFTREEINV